MVAGGGESQGRSGVLGWVGGDGGDELGNAGEGRKVCKVCGGVLRAGVLASIWGCEPALLTRLPAAKNMEVDQFTALQAGRRPSESRRVPRQPDVAVDLRTLRKFTS